METMGGKLAEIILKEENHSFAMNRNRPVKGEVKMEADEESRRVHVRLEAENLLPPDLRRYTYKLMLLGLKEGHSLHISFSDLKVSEKGEINQRFWVDAEDSDGRGHPLSSFTIFMIVAAAAGNRREPFHPVMKGDWDRQWNPALTQSEDTAPDEERKIFSTYYQTYVRDMTAVLISDKDSFRKTVPFEEGWLADNWRHVTADNLPAPGSLSDVVCRLPVASAGAERQVRQYGHFIFAFNDEYCLLGVPGKRDESDQPDKGASGFILWQHINGSEIYGYWLAAIQRKTGEIVGF